MCQEKSALITGHLVKIDTQELPISTSNEPESKVLGYKLSLLKKPIDTRQTKNGGSITDASKVKVSPLVLEA